MPRLLVVLAGILLLVQAGIARQIVEICGTNPERRKEELYLHRQAVLARRAARMQSAGAQSGTPRCRVARCRQHRGSRRLRWRGVPPQSVQPRSADADVYDGDARCGGVPISIVWRFLRRGGRAGRRRREARRRRFAAKFLFRSRFRSSAIRIRACSSIPTAI